ncbi:MAG: hypothetical protein PWR24_1392 [Desulfonauticus sp.]|nr:hypothetical protein [Desulfonauticus sp.]
MSLLEEVLDIGIALSRTVEWEKLLDLILTKARSLTSADAGSIYLVKNKELVFVCSQNDTLSKRLGKKKVQELFQSFSFPLDQKSIAGFVALSKQPLILADVYKEAHKYDLSLFSKWDRVNNYHSQSVLTLPLLNPQEEVVGVLQLINAREGEKVVPFKSEFLLPLNYFTSQAAVAIENARLYAELKEAHLDSLFRLGVAAEYRDKETSAHIRRVGELAKLLARELGFGQEELEMVFWAVAMHDVGKLGVPDAILLKPGPLTPQERKIMEKHTIIGGCILHKAKSSLLRNAKVVALTHHERYDGTGYPKGLKGEEIPLLGRIAGLVDVFDALSSARVYKPPYSEEKVRLILREEKGKHFDPFLVEILEDKWVECWKIKDLYQDEKYVFNLQETLVDKLWEEINEIGS